MAQTIKLKRSATQNAVPSTSQLELGEVAINTYDGKMFIKKDDGTESIVEVGQFATVTPAGSTGDLQFNNEGTLGAATFTFVDDANSRLGIGTDTPSTALEVSGTVTATTFDGSLDFSNLTNLPDPTLTLNGDVSGSATFTNLGNATLTVTVANDSHTHDGRYYTETEADNRFVNVTGDTLTGFLTLHADPTNALHAATKEYVDTVAAASLHYHTPVRLESPTALNATYNNGTNGVGATLTNAGTNAALEIDGVATSLNDRVLVYEQSNAAHNGVYTVTTVGDGSTPWVLTRATDADSYAPSDPDSFGQGDAFYVQEGNTGAGELYVMNTEGTITFGTTGINFVQISSAQIYSAGSGLDLNGTQFSHTDTSTQASVNNSGGTVIQDITLDTFGHITAIGSKTLSTSDISEGTNLYYTDARANSAIDARVDKTFVDALNVDADTLDSLNSTAFIRSDVDDTVAGQITFSATRPIILRETSEGLIYRPQESSAYTIDRYFLRFDYTNNGSYPYLTNRTPSGDVVIKTGTSAGGAEIERIRFNGGDGTQDIVISSATLKNGSNVYWHAGNDGAGSGLDADLLDGNDASAFVSESGDTMTGDLNFGDNVKAVFGAGSDLQIYSDGSAGVIQQSGTGVLLLKGEDFYVQNDAGNNYIRAQGSAQVDLYYGGSRKLATASAGIDVTGTVTADGLTVDGIAQVRGGLPYLYLIETDTTDLNTGLRGGDGQFQIRSFGDNLSTSTTRFRLDHATGDISFFEDTGTTAKFFWDASAESLGIGTTSPTRLLHVRGTSSQTVAVFDGGANAAGEIGFRASGTSGDTYVTIGAVANDMVLSAGASERLRITSSGNVGIGTSSPSSLLNVHSSTAPKITISNGGGTSPNPELEFFRQAGVSAKINYDTANKNLILQNDYTTADTSGNMYFNTRGANTRLTITGAGNVGIGTTTPYYQLHTVYTDNTTALSGGNGGAWGGNGLRIQNNSTTTGAMALAHFRVNSADWHIGSRFVSTSPDKADFFFKHENNEYVTFTNNGNVGIGTTSPTEPLTVSKTASGSLTQIASFVNPVGTASTGVRLWLSGTNTTTRGTFIDAVAESTSNNHSLRFGTSAAGSTPTERMRIDDGGNLLVGKTSAAGASTVGIEVRPDGDLISTRSGNQPLTLNRTTSDGTIAQFRKDNTTVGGIASVGGADIKVVFSGDGDQYITGNAASNYLSFSSANAERMRITSAGDVAIGTTSAFNVGGTARLTVAGGNFALGTTNSDLMYVRRQAEGQFAFQSYYNGNTGSIQLQPYGGSVGIGTTAPSAKLDVAGDIEVNSTFTLNGEEATLATTTQTEIASFSATSYGGGKFVITAKDGSNRHICELLVTHDGTTAVATQYGSIYTSTELATYNVDISSGNVRILATSASTNSTVYKVAETLMEA